MVVKLKGWKKVKFVGPGDERIHVVEKPTKKGWIKIDQYVTEKGWLYQRKHK